MLQFVRKLGIVAMAGALALSGVAADARPKLTGEEQLTKLLEGRVAGKPVECISLRTNAPSTVIDKTAIVYGSGTTIYVQRPKIGAASLNSNDILVTSMVIPQLCNIDTVNIIDRNTLFWRGFVGLDQFVPYTKPAKVALAN
jgi:hypothetical protein